MTPPPVKLPNGVVRLTELEPGVWLWGEPSESSLFCDGEPCIHAGACNALQEKWLPPVGARAWKPATVPASMTTLSCWALLQEIAAFVDRALLWGPPSTGKTHAALLMGLKPGQPSYPTTATPEMSAAEWKGVFSPKGMEGLVFMYGAAIRAFGYNETGRAGRLVINEFDKMSPDCQALAYLLCESVDTLVLTLPNNEVVRPKRDARGHTDYQVWVTMNSEPGVLPEALATRFPVKIHVDRINPEALMRFPREWHPVIEKVCLIADPKRRTYLREWLAFQALSEHVPMETAARATFGTRAADLLTALNLATAE